MSDPTPGDLFDRWLAHHAKDEAEGSAASTTPPPPATTVSETETVASPTPVRPVDDVVIQDTKASRAAARARLEQARAQEAAAAAAPRLTELVEAPDQPVRDRVPEPGAAPVAEPVPQPAREQPPALDPDALLERVLRATPTYRSAAPAPDPVTAEAVEPETALGVAESEAEVVPEPEPEPEAVVSAPTPPPVVEGRRKAPLEVAPDPASDVRRVGERIAPLETRAAHAASGHHLAAPTADVVLTSRERLAQQLRRPTRVPSQRRGQPVPPRPRTAPEGPTGSSADREVLPTPAPADPVTTSAPVSHEPASTPVGGSGPSPMEQLFVRQDRVRHMHDDDRPRYVSPAERAAASVEHRGTPGGLPEVVELTARRTPARRLIDYGSVPLAIGALLLLVIGLTGLTWAFAVAAMLGALAVVLLATRAATSSVLRVVVTRGSLEVERRSGWRRFDLEAESTQVVLVGSPSDIGWKTAIEGADGDRCVLDATVVDPEEFVRVLRHYRPDA